MHSETLNYTLNLPNTLNVFPTYHASQLKHHIHNDDELFLSRKMDQPSPVLTPEDLEEFHIERIIDVRCRGRSWQYLV